MLLADANDPSLDVTGNDGSARSFPVSAQIDVRDLDANENFERYITGEEKLLRCCLCIRYSNLRQTLLSNVE